MLMSCISNDFIVVNCSKLVKGNNIVFDIDGVLIDCGERLRRCVEESNGGRKAFWDCFLSPRYIHLDKPIEFGFEMLRDRIAKGFNVVIVTGRTDNMVSETLKQLKVQGVEGIPIVFRRRGNYAKDYIYKPSAAKRLGLDVREVHEDDFEVLKSFGEVYPYAKLYLYLFEDIVEELKKR